MAKYHETFSLESLKYYSPNKHILTRVFVVCLFFLLVVFFFFFFFFLLLLLFSTIYSEPVPSDYNLRGRFSGGEEPEWFPVVQRQGNILCETTAAGKDLPAIHIYRVLMSPAELEPTRQRCAASRETNFATD